jgi:hypothetical protein
VVLLNCDIVVVVAVAVVDRRMNHFEITCIETISVEIKIIKLITIM